MLHVPRLRSAARGDLQVSRIKTNFGSRAFAVAGPMFWNRLPPEIRANDSLQSFKSHFKTYYFLTLITSSAGALELDSMLWRLRSQHVIIILLLYLITVFCVSDDVFFGLDQHAL